MLGAGAFQRPGGEKLAKGRGPLLFRPLGADSEGFYCVMPVAAQRLALGAGQQVAEIAGAEALSRAIDGGESLLRLDRAVAQRHLPEADVAAAAGRRLLVEMGKQGLAAAGGAFAQRGQRLEALVFGAAARIRDVLFVDLAAAQRHVLKAVKGEGVGGQAVAAGAADLLVIGFDARGHVGVGDKTDVRLVHPHAEGDGGEGHDAVFAQEPVLIGVAARLVQPGVIDDGLEPLGRKKIGQPLRSRPRGAIDDAVLAAPRLQEMLQLFPRLVLGREGERNIRPVEGMDENLRFRAKQPLRDLGAHEAVGGGGEGDHLHLTEFFDALPDHAVFRAEIMAPFADAMGLVHGDAPDAGAGKRLDQPVHRQPLRRQEQKLQLSRADLRPGFAGLRLAGLRVERGRREAQRLHLPDLVAHQRDKWRYHQGQAFAEQRR